MKKTLFCLTSLAIIPSSQAVVTMIDNFSAGSTLAIQSGVGSTVDNESGLSTSSTIGGRRLARAHNTSGLGNNGITNLLTPGQFDWSVDTQTTGHFHLYYGFADYGATGASTDWNDGANTFEDLNADFSGETGITIDIVAADVSDAIRVGLITGRGGANETVVSLEVANSGGAETLTFNFADFTLVEGASLANFNLADVDQIIVEAANDLTSADWTLTTIGTVPEPSAALLGLVGLLGLTRRRR